MTGDRAPVWKPLLVVLVAVACGVLVWHHAPGVTGSRFHAWHPRRVGEPLFYFGMLAGAAPLVLSIWISRRAPASMPRILTALALMSSAAFAFGLVNACSHSQPFGMWQVSAAVAHPEWTSYFADADALRRAGLSVQQTLALFPELMHRLNLHSHEKPPGPILFYWLMLALFEPSPQRAALVGGLVVGAISSLSVAATYALVRVLTEDARAALAAAALVALAPSLAGFFPIFDLWYPLVTCGLLVPWAKGLRTGRARWAVLLGAVLCASTFMAYNTLVLGAFMVAYAILAAAQIGFRPIARRVLIHSVIALSVVAAFYALLWYISGFDPIATFRAALHNQRQLLGVMLVPRTWPTTIPTDLSDFALGAGYVTIALAMLWIVKRPAGARGVGENDAKFVRRVAWLALAMPLLVALTGLLQAETARVWAFLIPLVALPAGLELATWDARSRAVAYAAAWGTMVMVCANTDFLST
jgi:hypothetical protein